MNNGSLCKDISKPNKIGRNATETPRTYIIGSIRYNNWTTSHWAFFLLCDVILSKISDVTIGCRADKSRKSGCDSRRFTDGKHTAVIFYAIYATKKILIVCRARMFPPTFQRGSSLITNNRIQIQRLSELLRHLYFGCSFKSLILFMTCTHRCWTVLYTFKANFSTKLYGIRSLTFLVL